MDIRPGLPPAQVHQQLGALTRGSTRTICGITVRVAILIRALRSDQIATDACVRKTVENEMGDRGETDPPPGRFYSTLRAKQLIAEKSARIVTAVVVGSNPISHPKFNDLEGRKRRPSKMFQDRFTAGPRPPVGDRRLGSPPRRSYGQRLIGRRALASSCRWSRRSHLL